MRSRFRLLTSWVRLEDRLAPSAAMPPGFHPSTGLSVPFPGLVAVPAFTDLAAIPTNVQALAPGLSLDHMRAVSLDLPALKSVLMPAPSESLGAAVQPSITVTLPTPDGKAARFNVWEVSYTEPGYVTLNPDMKTYVGRGIDDPYASFAADFGGALGFHASVRSPNGSWYIDPYYHLSQSVYAVYDQGDLNGAGADFDCDIAGVNFNTPATGGTRDGAPKTPPPSTSMPSNGAHIQSFRLAVAATGEYTALFGGTVTGASAAITTAVSRVNQIYGSELAIRFILIANNNILIHTDPATDPYTSGDTTAMLTQNSNYVTSKIGSANFDIGHVFDGSDSGGLAILGSVGNDNVKAQGVSTSNTANSDAFFVRVVCHEIGHQFGAKHTFNGADSELTPNRDADTAYEPGAGTTIMSYAGGGGIDPANVISNVISDYFHFNTLDQISNFLVQTIPNVGSKTGSGNNLPVANGGNDYTIPANTPYVLTGSGSDADNDPLTYAWEQYDLGPSVVLGTPDSGSGPLYRSMPPSPTQSTRYFPDVNTALVGQTGTKFEVAASTTRDLNFRFTARDNRPDRGAFNTDLVTVHVVNTGSAFSINSWNSSTEIYAGTTQTVTWNVAGTNTNGINTSQVHIDLSTDGGYNFITLNALEANDGNAQVVIPANVATTSARFRVGAVGNVFYDITNASFTIKANPSTIEVYSPFDSGPGTLRQAILDSNAAPGVQTITFDPSFFNVARSITLTTGDFTISQAVTIIGPGSGLLTLSGNNVSRILNTEAAPAGASIKISGLTLANGKALIGGAIKTGEESLTIEDCVISNNSVSGNGGAINVQVGGSLTLLRVALNNNKAGADGGGIFMGGGSLTITDSSIANGSAGEDGGAINVQSAAPLTLLRSTVSGNTAEDDGGGVYFNNGGSLDLTNSTIANNKANTGSGGGLYFYGAAGGFGIRILHSTLANNFGAAGGGGIALHSFSGNLDVSRSTITGNYTFISVGGGGLLRDAASGTISFFNSIISGNTGPSSAPDVFSAGTVNVDYSAVGSTAGFTPTGGNNIIGQNLKLRPLANNGGPTLTVAFDFDSPLRNVGSTSVYSFDQRGLPRDSSGVDIGAFELQTTVTNTNSNGVGSLRDAVAESDRVVGTDTINFGSAFNTVQTIGLNTGEIALNDAVTIQGNGESLTRIDAFGISRIFNATAIPAGQTVTLRGLTLTRGKAMGDGGAIIVGDEYLVVEDSVVSNSSAVNLGGAISVGAGGKLSLVRSTLVGNSAATGGALRFVNGGNSEIIASSLVGNNATGGVVGNGGAIYLSGSGSTLTVLNSTLSGNSANFGGGIALNNFIGALTVRNTTITGNSAGNSGGGLDSFGGTPNINIESTIVSGNTAPTGPDISSTTTVTINRSAIGSAAGFTLTGANNLPFGANLKLGVLDLNGGPTLTHLPAGDSPLVNAGSNPASLATDQRGISRTLLGSTDIGSVELTNIPDTTEPTIVSITSITANGTYAEGAVITVSVNFSEPVTLNGTLTIMLNSGGAAYLTGPVTSTTLTGTYTVAAGQNSPDLNVISLSLSSGGTIRDAALNPAVLTLPANNLANNKDIVISTPANGNSTVTNLLDSGAGSLRAAIDKANSVPGANTILFDPNLTGTITLASQLDITEAVQILGPALAPVTISGNNAVRVFNTFNAPANAVINFTRLTIANGKAGFGAGLQMGNEAVLLDRVVFTNNVASVNGGAIYVGSGGSLTLQNSTISNNTASGSFGGGGIYISDAGVTILSSTLSGNSVTGGGNAGGGIFVRGSGNPVVLIRNCTLSGNSAPTGGGIAGDYGFNGTIDVQNSTITGNSANSGGGIDQNGYFGKVQLASTIVFGNTAPTGPDLRSSAVINVTTSLIGSTSGAFNFSGDTFTNSKIGVNPLLGPLTNNGGPTLTHGFAAGSPALDNGTNPFSEPYDQRGIGFPRVVGSKADIGAVEGAVSVPSLIVTNANDSGAGSLRQAILNANNLPGANTVTFDAAFFSTPRTISLTTAEIAISEALAITGPGASLATINGGNSRRLFNTTSAPAGAAISFSGLTFTAGNASVGGALLAEDEAITIVSSTISGNSATNGGGIAVTYGGTLNLTQSTVSGNSASLFGGGVYLNYSATSGASGIFTSSSIINNKASHNGGGLFILGNAGPAGLRFTNSTVAGNFATGKGGGVALQRLDNTFQAFNSTITNNTSGTGAFGGGGGGGIVLYEGSGTITIESSIVSGNISAEGGTDIQSPSVVNVNFSAIGSNSGFTLTGGNNLSFGAVLQLRPLASNGGPTQTIAFDASSPLRNAGSNALALSGDQRGINRNNGGVDIGAFELNTIVTNTNDSGTGSLRDAIAESNRVAGADVVTFDSTFASAKTITLTSGQIVFTDTTGATTISGPGVNLLTVSGNNLSRAFLINSGVSGAITGMTIANGNSAYGGAVQNSGIVTVSNSRFTNNKSDYGGAIFSVGVLSVSNSTFDNNAANFGTGWGGAIINGTTVGAANITACTFTNNYASLGGAVMGYSFNITDSTFANNTAGLNGGALRTDGTVVITGSTFSGNSAANSGGAIMSHGTTTIINSTVANNSARDGGGIEFFQGSGTMRNVTVAYNSATQNGGGTVNNVASVTAVNTIVAGNSSPDQPNVWGNAFTGSSSNNLLDMSAAAAGLGTLANNGGPTQTIALLPGSPAINAGTSVGVPTTDQRGLPRVDVTDIGAYEAQILLPAKISQITINGGAVQRSRVTSVTITFDHPVNFTTTPAAAFQLQRQSDGKLPSLSAAVNGAGTVVTLTFLAGDAVEFGSLSDGRYTLTVMAAAIASDGFDGDGNGTGGDDYVLIGNTTNKLFRLFGDADGDGDVDTGDFGQFRAAFGGSNNIFDYDNDGDVDTADFGAFRGRFGISIVP